MSGAVPPEVVRAVLSFSLSPTGIRVRLNTDTSSPPPSRTRHASKKPLSRGRRGA